MSPKKDPNLGSFTHRGLNNDTDLVFNIWEALSNGRIGDPFTFLGVVYNLGP